MPLRLPRTMPRAPLCCRGRRRAGGRAAGGCAAVAPRGHGALRMRRPDRLPRAAAGGGAAADRAAGRRGAADLPCAERAGGRARRRHRACPAARCRTAGRDAVARQVQPDPEDRSGGLHRRRAVRRAQPGDQRGRGAARPVLRARPEQPDRLHHRRQRGRELRRRALPEVRPDAAQRAARARLHGEGEAVEFGSEALGCAGLDLLPLSSAAKACWR